MKKTAIFILALAFVVGLTSPSFAALRKDRDVFRGKLVSVDRSKNEVVVKDHAGKETRFTVRGAIDTNLVTGGDVVVIYQLGTNVATLVKSPRKK
ncbi:MAG: hypothetical protein H6754_06630 [Candidatus Omnitrophica bacterium]|nr:hypothetical protein [Candidatus Omnitrophota bacterium]